MTSRPIRLLFAVAALLLTAACGRHDRAQDAPAGAISARHEHHAPHGGTPVALGDDAYHLELVPDAGRGVLQAYILDGHMEDFIRCAAPAFEIVATVAGEKRPLVFAPVGDPATGEKPGDTALFEATAGWLQTMTKFDGVLTSLTIRDSTFTAVAFRFPEGNEAH